VELDFDEGYRVFIGVYSIRDDGGLSPSADEIIVVFDDEVAQRYHIGPYEEDVSPPPDEQC
jgi:hypothetical protein